MSLAADAQLRPAVREPLGRVIASLADNKAAMGRRYGEWAVSAPTLESAVAAAAMAQDELGHARSTYPLLKHLAIAGSEDRDTMEIGGCLSILAAELPSWETFVAVNLVLDGGFTAFVATAQASAFAPLAQRARKILQEESAHAVHAAAWSRRLAQNPAHRDAFLSALDTCWAQVNAWPADPTDFSRLAEESVLSGTLDQMRRQLRARIDSALSGIDLTG
jgi:ring-1,2-phenylacetyl-CoA epoxidase subunit PaaC